MVTLLPALLCAILLALSALSWWFLLVYYIIGLLIDLWNPLKRRDGWQVRLLGAVLYGYCWGIPAMQVAYVVCFSPPARSYSFYEIQAMGQGVLRG